jgi:hypothetical protein
MHGEARLNWGDCNVRVGLEMALKTYKIIPSNDHLEEAVRAVFKGREPEALELSVRCKMAQLAVIQTVQKRTKGVMVCTR